MPWPSFAAGCGATRNVSPLGQSTQSVPSPTNSKSVWLRSTIIAAALVLATFFAYRGAGANGFVNLDDDAYVEFQPMVNQGLRSASVQWAFTSSHSTNWHPLTSLSHMLDCDLFGVRAGPMHWENVLWHALNAVLIFLVWRSLTGATWRPALVAALFALHPLHVESVAWISERKDLLSTFFWLLGIAAYLGWIRRPTLTRYLLVAAMLVLALLSKPMAVTFPCTLLLLDFWPLRRWPEKKWGALLWEKTPLFGLVAAHAVVTYVVQHAAGSGDFGQRFTLGMRLGNAVVSYIRYLGKTLWPEPLAAFYTHPGWWPLSAIAGAACLLTAVSYVSWRYRKAQPALLFGWLWFLGTLVPVIGLAQVGAQSMADRYTYVPLLGIFTAVIWIASEQIVRWPSLRLPVSAIGLSILAACTYLTGRQVSIWKDSVTLHLHSITAGADSATTRYLYAVALQATGRPADEVLAQLGRALEWDPAYVNAHTSMAVILLGRGETERGTRIIEHTRELEPKNPSIYQSLAALALGQRNPELAQRYLMEGLTLKPNSAPLHRDLALLYTVQPKPAEAIAEWERVVKLAPWDFDSWNRLGVAYSRQQRVAEFRRCAERARWINPGFAPALRNLRVIEEAERARAANPGR